MLVEQWGAPLKKMSSSSQSIDQCLAKDQSVVPVPLPAGLTQGQFNDNIRRAYGAAIDQAAGTSLGSTNVTGVAAAASTASGRRLLRCVSLSRLSAGSLFGWSLSTHVLGCTAASGSICAHDARSIGHAAQCDPHLLLPNAGRSCCG